jgi:hypothetical protein
VHRKLTRPQDSWSQITSPKGRASIRAAVAVAALVYGLGVIIIALAPHEGHTAAAYLGGAEVIGLLWYLLYLRPRIVSGAAGVTRKQTVEPEEHATALS